MSKSGKKWKKMNDPDSGKEPDIKIILALMKASVAKSIISSQCKNNT